MGYRMTARTLKMILAQVSDDTPIVVPTSDHHYLQPFVTITKIVQEGTIYEPALYEYHEGDVNEGDSVINAVVIG